MGVVWKPYTGVDVGWVVHRRKPPLLEQKREQRGWDCPHSTFGIENGFGCEYALAVFAEEHSCVTSPSIVNPFALKWGSRFAPRRSRHRNGGEVDLIARTRRRKSDGVSSHPATFVETVNCSRERDADAHLREPRHVGWRDPRTKHTRQPRQHRIGEIELCTCSINDGPTIISLLAPRDGK